jgi:RNA transcription, translation and transport factor protein
MTIEWLHVALRTLGCPLFVTRDELRSALRLLPDESSQQQQQQHLRPAIHESSSTTSNDTKDGALSNAAGASYPSTIRSVPRDDDDEDDDADENFANAVRWLEENCIRLYALDERERVFRGAREKCQQWEATALLRYLDDLECPYVQVLPANTGGRGDGEEGGGGEQRVDRESPLPQRDSFRLHALYWLVVCAASEAAYEGDYATTRTDSGGEPARARPTTLLSDGLSASHVEDLDVDDDNETVLRRLDRDFPLGFTTGDSDVDRALVVARMIQLVELEEEEDDQRPQQLIVQQGQQHSTPKYRRLV